MLAMPDKARASSARGISDEERIVDDELWAKQQFTDSRWVVPYESPDGRATSHANSKRWMVGCLLFFWVGASPLGVNEGPP
eukprot:5179877-Alexandrium_andersonii.AAC.1